MNTVFLLTSGDGTDGDEWAVISIHSSRKLAEIAQAKYSEPQKSIYGVTYVRESKIEEWGVDENAAQQPHAVDASPVVGDSDASESSGSRH